MTITRETLELAALAIGETIECTEAEFNGCEPHSTLYTGVMLRGVQIAWRPSTDIGDAARLAVRIGMDITTYKTTIAATVDGWSDWASVSHDGTEPGKLRAYCEAVTLCAAEIGRKMKEMNHGPA